MDKMDLYTNLSNKDNINNGYWTPIFEIINKIEINRIASLIFEVTEMGHGAFKRTKYFVDISYSPNRDASITFNWFDCETFPIECCYVRDVDNNKVVFYIKPAINGRSIQVKFLNGTKEGFFRKLSFSSGKTDLSNEVIVLPNKNLFSSSFAPPQKWVSKNSYTCYVGTNVGTYHIGNIFCSNGYASNVLTLLITSIEGDNSNFTQAIATIRYRKTSNTSFSYRISVINGNNTDNKLDNKIKLGISNIDNDNLGIYLTFEEPYSGVLITPLSFGTGVNAQGKFRYVEPVLVSGITMNKEVSLSKQSLINTTELELLNGWNVTSGSEYIRQQVKNGVCIITVYNVHAGTVSDGTVIARLKENKPSKNISVSIASTVIGGNGTPKAILNSAGELSIRNIGTNAIIAFEMMYFV